ncbi:hypothetical protein Mucpa_0901 [Mucilaginibacter paludis DSM 18603]|uniref:Uncharacterized protein n=1 Tax=Mucilaginibacter paludis DSM 18603 TaxID=714943 RepID=H1YBL1_9SPHI|nr:hypothetical protein Mucpa_0901 [Mucilaginibacter paludis DSM 18603]
MSVAESAFYFSGTRCQWIRNIHYRDLILTVESHEQQRREIGYDGLRDKAEVTGPLDDAVVLGRSHYRFSQCFPSQLRTGSS